MLHLLFLILLYFLPTVIASQRGLHQRTAIALLNFFLGWTGIGWVIALIWAICASPPYIAYMRPPYPPYGPYYR